MAQTTFGVGHPLAVSVWSKDLAAEAIRRTFIGLSLIHISEPTRPCH
jgi:hypothetical protein